MFYITASIALLVGLIGAAGLHVFARYQVRDLMVLAFLGWTALYLSRWDLWAAQNILGRPYPGIYIYLSIFLILLLLFRLPFGLRPSLRMGLVLLIPAVFVFLTLVSGAANGASRGIPAAIQVITIFGVPMLTTAMWVDIVPRTPDASRRLRISFILLCGLMAPLMVIVTSIAPNLFGSLLGWAKSAADQTRGFSPIGTAIATGMVVVMAFGMAMHEVVGNRKRIFIVILVLTGVAAMFSLARSVVLMLFIFNAVYFALTMRRHAVRIVVLLAIGAIVSLPIIYKLQQRYTFERLTMVGGASMDIRSSSALAAGKAMAQRPLFGHGPGLLYEEVRTDWLLPSANRHKKSTVVMNLPSAMEPHNVYLLIGAEHGLPALLVFCLFLAVLWRRSQLPAKDADPSEQSISAMYCALWFASGVMLLTSSSVMLNAQTSVFFWLFAFSGVHWRVSVEAAHRRQPAVSPQPVRPGQLASWRLPVPAQQRGV